MASYLRWCVLIAVTLNWFKVNAGPVSIYPSVSPFGSKTRPMACKSKSGQHGVCMFAMDCTMINGEHLGVCIDGFYFGSCCSTLSMPVIGNNDLGDLTSPPPLKSTATLLVQSTEHPNALGELTNPFATISSTTLGATSTSSTLDELGTTLPSTVAPPMTSGVELTVTETSPPLEADGITESTTQAGTDETASTEEIELVTSSEETHNLPGAPETSSSSTTPASSSITPLETSIIPDVTTKHPVATITIQSVTSAANTTETSVLATTPSINLNDADQFPDYRQVCGVPKYKYPSARIVGGTTTNFGQWPWQISLRHRDRGSSATSSHKCGAVLLNENWAITAAHCLNKVRPEDLLLRMGEYDFSTDVEEYPYAERQIQIVESHPQFNNKTFEYDLALLRFYDPVRFQPNIIPICLPPVEMDYVDRTAFVTGWGLLYKDQKGPVFPKPLPTKMQQVSLPLINHTECENMFRRAGYVEHIPNIFFCAGYTEGKRDACDGDSGGPLVIQEDDRWVLFGVVSWGIGCALPNQPGVYTRITEFREWIDKIIVF